MELIFQVGPQFQVLKKKREMCASLLSIVVSQEPMFENAWHKDTRWSTKPVVLLKQKDGKFDRNFRTPS
jgi:hypothetical protein